MVNALQRDDISLKRYPTPVRASRTGYTSRENALAEKKKTPRVGARGFQADGLGIQGASRQLHMLT